LFETDNGGNNWRKVNYVDNNVAVRDVVVDDSSRVFVATNMGLFSSLSADLKKINTHSKTFRSSNAQTNKDTVNRPFAFPKQEVTTVFISKVNPSLMFAGVKKASIKGSALFRSKDNGSSWEKVLESTGFYSGITQQGNAPYSIIVATNDHNYHDQSAGSGVYISDDSGDSWESINTGLPVLRAWNITTGGINSNDVYLCANGSGVFVYSKESLAPNN
jgi:photosystem II stability/assembly factor-like uncharacterized protein